MEIKGYSDWSGMKKAETLVGVGFPESDFLLPIL